MSALVAAVVVALLSAPAPLPAQQWSPEQQEVIEGVKECWDIWMQAVEQGTPEPFLSQCVTDDGAFWVSTQGAPNKRDFLVRNWGEEVGIDLGWIDLRPLMVSVHDDVAVIHFYSYWRLPGPNVAEWKRTEVWRREDGRWRQWAGHATPVAR